MRDILNRVRVGWKVDIIDHDYTDDSREGCAVAQVSDTGITIQPKKAWSSQGRAFTFTRLDWARETEESGNVVRLYHTPPAHTGKSRRLVRTYTFTSPKA